MQKILSVGLALAMAAALAAPPPALADTAPSPAAEIQSLRDEIKAMRAAYEARLQALEERLSAAQQPPTAAPAGVAAGSGASAGATGANSFNPAVSLILSGGYTGTTQDSARYSITGFQLPADTAAGPGARGFSLGESELGLAANIDPWLRGQAHLALHPDNTVSVEEAYVQTTSLGNGLTAKAGRFFSGIGYLNSQHAHTWDFADSPLAYQAMLGTQYGDDGLQLHWLAPTDQYLELGVEVARGRSFPGTDTGRNGAGMTALTAHTGGDIGDSHNWRAGLSVLTAQATDQGLTATDAAGALINNRFNGDTRVWVADAVWKWAPNGNATRTSFKLQGEYLQSTRNGSLTYDTVGANVTDAYSAVQSGWYLQAVYQFMPRWRVGLRTERLSAGTPAYGINATRFVDNAYQPGKDTLMLDFNPSEFSRLRLQLAQDRSRQGLVDNQVFLQYQMSLGAHGAHRY
jgi:hypothetical protein